MTSNKYQNPGFKCKICKGEFEDGQNIVIHVFSHNYDDDMSSWLYHEACKLKQIKKRLTK